MLTQVTGITSETTNNNLAVVEGATYTPEPFGSTSVAPRPRVPEQTS
jgi:hypothetical protein